MEGIFGKRMLCGITTQGIKYLSEKDYERNVFLKTDDINRLVDASQEVRGKFYLPALIYLGAEHGTSKQVALSLRWEDIDFSYDGSGLIRIFRTKNGHERTEFLIPRARQGLICWKDHVAWMQKRKRIEPISDEYVFCRLNGIPIKRFDSAWNTLCDLEKHYRQSAHQTIMQTVIDLAGLAHVRDLFKQLGKCLSEASEAQMFFYMHCCQISICGTTL